jgi:NADH dehydrogenase
MAKPRILIIGGGFGGLAAAGRLKKLDAEVVLFDRQNHHLFQPLLYQVATAGLSPSQIAVPIRSVFSRKTNIAVRMEEIKSVDLEQSLVRTSRGSERYDYLIIAAGSTNSYFGHDDWGKYAVGLKSIDEALEIRRRFLACYEQAELEENAAIQRSLMTFVVVGGGPTGVELAGALAEIATRSLPPDFRNIETSKTRIVLVEAGDRLLSAFDTDQSERAKRDLLGMGVEVRLNTSAEAIDKHGINLQSKSTNERIDAGAVYWAAGVKAEAVSCSVNESTQGEKDNAGRIVVEQDLSVSGHPNVFAIGDIAKAVDERGIETPGVAQGAIQMGKHVGAIIANEISSGSSIPPERKLFRYKDKGNMATIGRRRAVADLGWIKIAGLPAWLLWAFVHVMFLVGFRNKFVTMIEWIYMYITFGRGARLITGQPRERDDSSSD